MAFHYKNAGEFSLQQALSLEWLETNGLGGYASSSVSNCHTRKYHGLLVAALPKLGGKFVLLSKFDDGVKVTKDGAEDKFFGLSSHQYPDCLCNDGYSKLREFVLDTHPHFVYEHDGVVVSKEILMPHGENTILVKYKLLRTTPNSQVTLRIRPLFAYRNFHELTQQNESLNVEVKEKNGVFSLKPYPGMPESYVKFMGAAEFAADGVWYNNFSYSKEMERGFVANEDLFSVGYFDVVLNGDNELIFSYSLTQDDKSLLVKWHDEIVRRMNLITKRSGVGFQKHLKKIAADFVVHDPSPKSDELALTAGYHWFLNWGRDTMISLPGICLYSGMEKEFLKILYSFSKHEKDGLIPNFLGSAKEDDAYNSVDASLWFAWAVQQYYLKTRDLDIIERYFWATLKNIFTNYRGGTIYNIKLGEDFLLYAGWGDSSLNLTWMDALSHGVSATPRNGAPVEVNALWYNMLCFIRVLALQYRDPIEHEVAVLIPKVRKAFRDNFWDERLGFLKDVVVPGEPENMHSFALRPNQIFAVSLPYSPLTQKAAAKVVAAVKDKLLTPYGLRTLAPDHELYSGRYEGGVDGRAHAYHNGTVWPWLLCHFAEAMLKVTDKKKVIATMKPCVNALAKHLRETGGVGTISEIFDGDTPHTPRGCISQAWSVAELLRLTYIL